MTDRNHPEDLTLEQAIGQVLRQERLDRGLTQIEVSAATDFGVRSIGNMEHGTQSMTIRSLDALAMFYSLPIEEVIIRAKRLRGHSL
jgi:transcriptional regulator with XRE-family HTH domain